MWLLSSLRRSLATTSARLALSYLVIIMLMSLGFSIIFYQTSSHELGRQVPPPDYGLLDSDGDSSKVPQTRDHRYDEFFVQRIDEARHSLMEKLIIVNVATLVLGAIVSYGLARRTLRPIEANMDAQVQFVSDASHELRTPLTSLKAANEVALRRTALSVADARQILRQNVDDVTRLQELSDNLLRLARPDHEPLVSSAVSLQEVAADAMNHIIQPAQAKQIQLEDNVAATIVTANHAALTQVVVILLDNAVKYSPKRSKITLASYTRGGFGYLSISDRGVGIKAVDLPHVFKRFYRADTARSGTGDHDGYGIGLAIADKIIRLHGGNIAIVSSPGNGSTFTIKLPLYK